MVGVERGVGDGFGKSPPVQIAFMGVVEGFGTDQGGRALEFIERESGGGYGVGREADRQPVGCRVLFCGAAL